MTDLSPAAAAAVLDAFLRAPCDYKLSVAAALRAAALYSHCSVDRRILMTIADELEGAQ